MKKDTTFLEATKNEELKKILSEFQGHPFYFGTPLSSTDKEKIESIQSLLPGISMLLGGQCEIILHSFDDPEHAIIAAYNAGISRRTVGMSVRPHGCKLIMDIINDEEKYSCTFSLSVSGHHIKSLILPLMNDSGRCIGSLSFGMNLDIPLREFMESMNPIISKEYTNADIFGGNREDYIQSMLNQARHDSRLEPNLKQRDRIKFIVNKLNESGSFQLRNAVQDVSEMLGVTVATIYMHLRALKAEKNKVKKMI